MIRSEAVLGKETMTRVTVVVKHLQQCQHNLSGNRDKRHDLIEMAYLSPANLRCNAVD